MDLEAEAVDYDAMDHAEVNRRFETDLLGADADVRDVIDVGTGTALIPIALCRVTPQAHVTAVDAAAAMLRMGRVNVVRSDLVNRIELVQVDAKRLPFPARRFSTVMSNSIVHHIPEPLDVLREAVRVVAPGGTLFVRDLMRPDDQVTLERLVDAHAAGANDHQRQMFADSLHAALTLEEIRDLIEALGFDSETVQASSDRHWTWCAKGLGVVS